MLVFLKIILRLNSIEIFNLIKFIKRLILDDEVQFETMNYK